MLSPLFLHPGQAPLIDRHSPFCWVQVWALSPYLHDAPGTPTNCRSALWGCMWDSGMGYHLLSLNFPICLLVRTITILCRE
jgi:hypothetical protein